MPYCFHDLGCLHLMNEFNRPERSRMLRVYTSSHFKRIRRLPKRRFRGLPKDQPLSSSKSPTIHFEGPAGLSCNNSKRLPLGSNNNQKPRRARTIRSTMVQRNDVIAIIVVVLFAVILIVLYYLYLSRRPIGPSTPSTPSTSISFGGGPTGPVRVRNDIGQVRGRDDVGQVRVRDGQGQVRVRDEPV